MPKHPLTTRIRRRGRNNRGVGSPIPRQWKFLERLSSDSHGATISELATAMGVDGKTIRRDLILFKQIGFDAAETVGKHGRKSGRILPRFETMRTKQQQYRSIRDSLAALIEQVASMGDQPLAGDLELVQRKVARKGR